MSQIFPLLRQARLLACALLLFAPAHASRPAETGDLPALREQALELVNAARREHGREPLRLSDTLNQAAQDHAEDMLARGYYSHVSPEGEDARDRYLARGGDRWQLVGENIASCSPCAVVPGASQVEQMHRRWMESPHHRENVLNAGFARLGFGIVAGENGPLYAVQIFAGPGAPRGEDGSAGEVAGPLAPDAADDAFARAVNARRDEELLAPLEVSEALSEVAAGLLPESAAEEVDLGAEGLAGEARGSWASLSLLAGACGGCGAEPVEDDIEYFLEMWLEDSRHARRLLGPGPTSVGFALRAYGDGRKVAVAVLGERR